jgi:hypothetical protein
MSLDFEDANGKPVSALDIDDAIEAAQLCLRPDMLMKLPPQLVTNVPNILRCLRELRERGGGAR